MAFIVIGDTPKITPKAAVRKENLKCYYYSPKNSSQISKCLNQIKKYLSSEDNFFHLMGIPRDTYGFENIEFLFMNSKKVKFDSKNFYAPAAKITNTSEVELAKSMLLAKAAAFYNSTPLFKEVFGDNANTDMRNVEFFTKLISYYNTKFNR